MNATEYCQDKAARSGSSFYYSFLFLPEKKRHAITALYAFCREVDDVVDECADTDIARQKLTWWKEEIYRTFHAQPLHPVGLALQASLANFNLGEQYFYEIIAGMLMDLEKSRYQNFDELSLYCYRVAGVVGLLAAEIFGYSNKQTLVYAEKLGLAFQLTNIIRDVKEDAERNRIYLPQEDLIKFNVNDTDILKADNNRDIRQLLKFQVQRAETCYQQAMAQLPDSDRYPQRTGLIMSAIYHALLDKIATHDFDVFSRTIKISPLRKLWIAWRTSRHEAQRHKRLLKHES